MGILTTLIMLVIKGYQYCISPFTPAHCRYLPTCSCYAAEAVQKHGAWYGVILTVKRIMRCHPWGGSGFDPVPPHKTKTLGF